MDEEKKVVEGEVVEERVAETETPTVEEPETLSEGGEQDFQQLFEEEKKKSSGLLSDLMSERKIRQELQRSFSAPPIQGRPPAEDPLASIQDDDYVSGSQVKKIAQHFVGQIRQGEQARFAAEKNRIFKNSVENAKRTHKEDYEEVIGYFQKLADTNPALANAVLGSEDPAETAYQMGRSHPEFLDKVKTRGKQEVVETISTPKATTLAGGGKGGGRTYTLEQIAEMSPEQIAKLPKDVVKKALGG